MFLALTFGAFKELLLVANDPVQDFLDQTIGFTKFAVSGDSGRDECETSETSDGFSGLK